jgi:hypothetical protein
MKSLVYQLMRRSGVFELPFIALFTQDDLGHAVTLKTKLRGRSLQANYANRATTAGR